MHQKHEWLILFLGLCLSPLFAVAGEQPITPLISPSSAFPKLSYAPIVKKAAPAVVSISTLQKVDVPTPLFSDDPFFNFFFGNNASQAGGQLQRLTKSLGSGVIVDSSGIVITCAHVVENAQKIVVRLSDNREFEGTVVVKDLQNDLAAIRLKKVLKGFPLPSMTFETNDVEVGDCILAIGNPFGIGQTVTNGIVSAIARNVQGRMVIQIDASVNPGNSGGALVSSTSGKLIGIPNAILSKTGASHGIGFAIPVALIRMLLISMSNGGVIIRPWTGIDVQPLTGDLASTLGLPFPQGVLVANLHEVSPGRIAGLAQGDVITAINDQAISNPEDFIYRIQSVPFGQTISLSIVRNNQAQRLTFQPIQPPQIPAPDQRRIMEPGNLLQDIEVANLSPALVSSYQLPLDTPERGVVITDTGRNSLALELNLQKGNIIESINQKRIRSVQQLIDLLPLVQKKGTITIRQGNRRIEIKKRI